MRTCFGFDEITFYANYIYPGPLINFWLMETHIGPAEGPFISAGFLSFLYDVFSHLKTSDAQFVTF